MNKLPTTYNRLRKILTCWFVGDDDLSFASFIVPVVTSTAITLSSNKIQNGDFLVPANPGLPGKWPLKWTERDDSILNHWGGIHRIYVRNIKN